ARFIGAGAIMSAWVIAFRIPNTFRRFFGEGASSQALIPMIEHITRKDGAEEAKKSFGIIFATLGLVLAVISILSGFICIFLLPYFYGITRIYTALLLLPILMPYTVFICLTGICCGILNLKGKFFLPALASVILNIFIIATLVLFGNSTAEELIIKVCWAVLISGIVQLAVMLFLLKKINFLPAHLIPEFINNETVKDFVNLAVPGFIGAAAVQINILVDSFIALYLGNYAAPALYYSERIVYLPLGIFAVSLGNASLVTMSKLAAEKKYRELALTLSYGLRQIIFLTVPICLFFVIFRTELISLLYKGNQFGLKDITETAWAMLFYCFGIPAFAGVKVAVSGFYAQKDMKTPLNIALFCVVINFVLNLFLMFPLRQGGIALSTTISSYINCSVLFYLFIKNNKTRHQITKKIAVSAVKILTSAAIAVFACQFVFNSVSGIKFINAIDWRNIISLFIAGTVFCIIYFILNLFFKSDEQNEWFKIFTLHQ
ncbi:MAG: murein biosynthesis integral membrane protein MurJ, partial [Victivallales bacterium]|nr:murein biosynthesis integral membrane protein MurJ [Victivallales bacterium]